MPASNFLRTRQSAKRAAGTRIHKPTENKRASTRVRHHQKTILDIDSPVHADSTLSVREAMGPTFKDTFVRIDAMNGKEEKRFMLVAETFLGPQRVLSVTKQFAIGDWNCDEYFAQASQKLEANASKRGIGSFTLTHSKALISAKNMPATKHINADVMEPNDWGNVEESVQFLMESKCKGIRVDFKMQYEPTTEAQQEEDDDDNDEVEIIDIRAPKKVLSIESFLIVASYSYHRFK